MMIPNFSGRIHACRRIAARTPKFFELPAIWRFFYFFSVMTEFRKASATVEMVEKLVQELQDAKSKEGEVQAEVLHSRWTEVEKHFSELSPIADKMQRRCDARGELERLKEELRALLPPCSMEESMKKAQEIVDNKTEGFQNVQGILSQALELEAAATYGVKMAEKVSDLLARLKTARDTFEALKTVLEPLVRQFDQNAAASAAERQKQEEAARQAAEREAAEAARILQAFLYIPIECIQIRQLAHDIV